MSESEDDSITKAVVLLIICVIFSASVLIYAIIKRRKYMKEYRRQYGYWKS